MFWELQPTSMIETLTRPSSSVHLDCRLGANHYQTGLDRSSWKYPSTGWAKPWVMMSSESGWRKIFSNLTHNKSSTDNTHCTVHFPTMSKLLTNNRSCFILYFEQFESIISLVPAFKVHGRDYEAFKKCYCFNDVVKPEIKNSNSKVLVTYVGFWVMALPIIQITKVSFGI